jgi:hypothetical protein
MKKREKPKAMSIIQKAIVLEGNKKTEEAQAIFDSGATYSCIQPELAERLETVLKLPQPMEFGTAKNGGQVTAFYRVNLNFYLDDLRFSDEFMVIPELSQPVLIGAATQQKWRMKLDLEHDQVILDPRVTQLWLM